MHYQRQCRLLEIFKPFTRNFKLMDYARKSLSLHESFNGDETCMDPTQIKNR